MRRPTLALVAVVVAALVMGAGITAVIATGAQQPAQTPTQAAIQSSDHAQVASQSAGQSGSSRTIRVSASGRAASAADQATIRVAVVATGEDAPTVRQRLAENVSQMREALAEIGVSGDQIRTNRFDLEQDRRPPRPEREGEGERGKPRVQYRGQHSFTITVTDLNRTGTIIDTAVTNGADNIEDIRFTLSADQRRSLRKQALRDAMANAEGQAETLANASELTLAGVHTVQTSDGIHRGREVAFQGGDGGGAVTDVEGGPVSVQVQVQVVYNATAS